MGWFPASLKGYLGVQKVTFGANFPLGCSLRRFSLELLRAARNCSQVGSKGLERFQEVMIKYKGESSSLLW